MSEIVTNIPDRLSRQIAGRCCYGACPEDALAGSDDCCEPHDAHEKGKRAKANGRSMLTSDTIFVEGVKSDVESRPCARRGCRAPAAEDSERCADCDEKQREYQRAYMARKRRRWRRAKRCTRCGCVRAVGFVYCAGCQVEVGKVPTGVRNRNVESRRDRIRARSAVSTDGRLRYHGQGRRGAPPVEQIDGVDLRHARIDFDHGVEGLVYFRSEAVQAMPRLQREDVRSAALAKLAKVRRWLGDVLARHRYDDEPVTDDCDEGMPTIASKSGKMNSK